LSVRTQRTVRSVGEEAESKRFGTTHDGLLFRGERGSPLSESVYGRAWRKAREKALTPSQVTLPLAGRPYDLRHSSVTLGLNAGVPAPKVARRAGHSVDVLRRVYAGCIDGHEQMWNGRIDDALQDAQGEQGLPGRHPISPITGRGGGSGAYSPVPALGLYAAIAAAMNASE
jgi:integrase